MSALAPESDSEVELSLVVPMFNEEDASARFFDRVLPLLNGLRRPFEIVCVDDGSRDRTLEQLVRRHEQDPRVKIVSLARNFGKEMALTAGLRFSVGKAVVPIDVDLQDPPELLPQLLQHWERGAEIVVAVRRSRPEDSMFQRLTAAAFYRLFNKIAVHKLIENAGDFCLLDRSVVRHLNRISEKNRFMKGLFAWAGYRRALVYYDRPKRCCGKSKWNLWKLWNFALDGITSFSTVPLRVWTYLGGLIALAAFLYALVLIVRALVMGVDVPGHTSLMVVVLFLAGIQLISLGVLGEYIGRIYMEAKGRPEYLVRAVWGFGEAPKGRATRPEGPPVESAATGDPDQPVRRTDTPPAAGNAP